MNIGNSAQHRRAGDLTDKTFRALIEHARDVIVLSDSQGTVLYVSPSVELVLGYTPAQYTRTTLWDHIHPEDVTKVADSFTVAIALPGVPRGQFEFRHRHADGSWRWMEATASNLLDDPAVRGVVCSARDVTERKALQTRLGHRASHDTLTDLPNRGLLMERVDTALERATRSELCVALLFVDLDRLKRINDWHGHAAGDALLVAVARRLQALVRPDDLVARLGGDEFVILLDGIGSPEDASRVARRAVAAVQEPVHIMGEQLRTGVSIGIALATDGQQAAAALLSAADAAMYRAKRGAEAPYVMHGTSVDATAPGRWNLELDLRVALERGEFRLYYQPEVELATGRIVGFEALLRWEHPKYGLMSPADFIPLAEEINLIVAIGRWVVEQAYAQAKVWHGAVPRDPPLWICTNLSVRELDAPDLVAATSRALAAVGLDPRNVQVEITESAVMGNVESSAATLRQLKGLGVGLAIDDFGTGQSSLAYLKRFPADILKIDRAFVSGLGTGGRDEAIARAVITLAAAMGMQAHAEGIETPEQLGVLRAMGCAIGQGYLFAPPLSGDDAGAALSRGNYPV